MQLFLSRRQRGRLRGLPITSSSPHAAREPPTVVTKTQPRATRDTNKQTHSTMGLFGKSEEKDDEGDTPPAVAKKDDDRHLRRQDSEAPTTVCPCACGNRFLDWMKGFIEIKPFKVEPRLAQMRWDEIRRENPLMYRNRHLGCFLCKHIDPLRACLPGAAAGVHVLPLAVPHRDAHHVPALRAGGHERAAREGPPACCCSLGAQGCIACSALAGPFFLCAFQHPSPVVPPLSFFLLPERS